MDYPHCLACLLACYNLILSINIIRYPQTSYFWQYSRQRCWIPRLQTEYSWSNGAASADCGRLSIRIQTDSPVVQRQRQNCELSLCSLSKQNVDKVSSMDDTVFCKQYSPIKTQLQDWSSEFRQVVL